MPPAPVICTDVMQVRRDGSWDYPAKKTARLSDVQFQRYTSKLIRNAIGPGRTAYTQIFPLINHKENRSAFGLARNKLNASVPRGAPTGGGGEGPGPLGT